MGKRFYARHIDKRTAMAMANKLAKAYKAGKCYTPSKAKECVFNPETSKWKCSAPAHHQYGSCGTGTISTNNGTGTPWSTGLITVITWNKSIEEKEPIEVYSDALPEDYADLSELDLSESDLLEVDLSELEE